MANTITLLDALQYAKTVTSDVYTIDGDGQECVKTYAIQLPSDISAARVIFNNNYGATGSRVHARVKLTKMTIPPLAKTENTLVMEWTAIALAAIVATGVIDVSAGPANTLHIALAISGVTAHLGTEIIVQIRSYGSPAKWTTMARLIGPTGTCTKSDCSGTTAAGQVIVGVTAPATGNLNHLGKFVFLEDTATIAQCEIAYEIAQSGN